MGREPGPARSLRQADCRWPSPQRCISFDREVLVALDGGGPGDYASSNSRLIRAGAVDRHACRRDIEDANQTGEIVAVDAVRARIRLRWLLGAGFVQDDALVLVAREDL